MPRLCCVYCKKRIETNERKRKISDKSFFEIFKSYVGDQFKSYGVNDILCNRCHIKVSTSIVFFFGMGI